MAGTINLVDKKATSDFEVRMNHFNEKGLFTKIKISKGDIISSIQGKVKKEPDKYSIQIAQGKHIEVDSVFKFMNHNCSPSVHIKERFIYAVRNLKPGDEITFDYNTTEDYLASPFKCECCGNIIKGREFYK
ncbi:MAG: SET domain-containing protein-lysine N-methyltransferase [bacterium]